MKLIYSIYKSKYDDLSCVKRFFDKEEAIKLAETYNQEETNKAQLQLEQFLNSLDNTHETQLGLRVSRILEYCERRIEELFNGRTTKQIKELSEYQKIRSYQKFINSLHNKTQRKYKNIDSEFFCNLRLDNYIEYRYFIEEDVVY